MKITRTKTKVLFHTKSGIVAISQNANVIAHPRLENAILISSTTDPQHDKTFVVYYDDLKDYKNDPIVTNSRDEMIELLSKRYFNPDFKIDVTRFLDTNGDGSGVKDFKGDYSSGLTKAIIKPANKKMLINRWIAFIADNGRVDAGYYGNNITLNNGILIKHEKQDGTLIKDFTDGMPIKTNADYAKFGFQVSDISFGAGLNYVHAVLTFVKNGCPLILEADEQLAIYFNDNFSALKSHTFRAGAYEFE